MPSTLREVEEGKCKLCGKKSERIASELSLCLECIRAKPAKAREISAEIHAQVREKFGLPGEVPDAEEGVECDGCANRCVIPEGGKGYCGLSWNEDGELKRELGTTEKGLGRWYKDSHPTNCVAAWCCAGGTGAGYPEYAKSPEGDSGFYNAAVFLGTCCYHCLYCQNTSWHRMAESQEPVMKSEQLAEEISDPSITCVCWFGGTPEPQMPFVYEVSKRAREKAKEDGRILRTCLEANGNFSWPWLERVAKISLESGGGIKFDLKAWDESLNFALSGVSNKATYRNFKKLGKFHGERGEPPFLRASTLLVPGYIDEREVKNIASFIASVDPSIPYSLLAFGPAYRLKDQPLVKKDFAQRAKEIAQEEGLERVRIGNKHLLS